MFPTLLFLYFILKDEELQLEVGDRAQSYKAAQYGSALTNHAKMPLDDKH